MVGAVALSSPPRIGAAAFAVFQTAMTRILLISALGAIVFAIIVAVLLSRRLTRPLARLTTATARMANGDYATRVDVRSPDEYRRLAATFNEMAAALEHDVNELQRQEQMRRDLVANVSHELATPLTAISGFTEALLDGMLHSHEEREETVRRIARESSRLRRLVDQLRQVARYEAGAQSLDRAPLQLQYAGRRDAGGAGAGAEPAQRRGVQLSAADAAAGLRRRRPADRDPAQSDR